MGEVYRATDTKLGRDVALKVLPADVARDPERLARFQREARAVAALNHPHIITLFSVEEDGGIHFLTMELVEGQSLDKLIPAEGLPVQQIVEIASALAEALTAAHEKGIVHRDLKPANVMITSEGRVKVLDFGLAKDVSAGSASDATLSSSGRTEAGIIMGTPAYMSPEQVSGRPLDQRTDIFSLGVMLHEMATGRRPFGGTSSAELISSILRDTPPLVTDVRADLPADLARVIRRCLEKDPRHRMQTARAAANEFRDLARNPTRTSPPTPSSTPRTAATPDSGVARAEEGFWVAVLPFKSDGSSAEQKSLAEALSEEIVAGLSRFSYLRVITSASTRRYADQSPDVRAVGKELGARYVMSGTLRQAGSRLRVAVQLVDASTGAQLWAETYERAFSPDAIFELQDELVPRIVSTVADQDGILPHSMAEAIRFKNDDQLTPLEAVLRTFSFFKRLSPSEHAQMRRILENTVRNAPHHADSWAMLSMIYGQEHRLGFNPQPDSLPRALDAARRAVEIGPSNHLAHWALAIILFSQKDLIAFRAEADRSIDLNRMDGSTIAFLGFLIAVSGDWDRGCALAESGSRLNPGHAAWHRAPVIYNAYRQGKYREALDAALHVDMPGYFNVPALRAAAFGQLGEREAAEKALAELLAIRPNFASTARGDFGRWFQPALVEQLIDGLRKAGLVVPPEKENAAPASAGLQSPTTPRSGSARATPAALLDSQSTSVAAPSQPVAVPRKPVTTALLIGVGLLVVVAVGAGIYWKMAKTAGIDSIAVLPLETRSNDADADYISDGITESVTDSLTKLASLRVVPKSVASHYKGKSVDLQKTGDELHVASVLTGRVTQRGDDLTIDMELDDVGNGKQLWGQQYHGKMADLLSVQGNIAKDVSDRLGSQLSAAAQAKLAKGSTENPEAYQLYLKGKYYTNKFTKDGFDKGIDYFNQAIAIDPNYGRAYSGLAFNYLNQDDWYLAPNLAAPKTKAAAEKALAIDDSDGAAHFALAAEEQWYEWNWDAADREFKRAIEVSPNDANAHGYYAWFLAMMGRKEEAAAEAKRGQQADPLSSQANCAVGAVDVFSGNYDAAIQALHSAEELDPTYWLDTTFLGRAYEEKKRLPDAIAEFQHGLQLDKDNAELWSKLGHAYGVSGRKADAQKAIDHLKELSASKWVAPYNVALIYAGLGDKEQTFAWLEKAFKDRSYYLGQEFSTDSRLDFLKTDPRFADLWKRVGLPSR